MAEMRTPEEAACELFWALVKELELHRQALMSQHGITARVMQDFPGAPIKGSMCKYYKDPEAGKMMLFSEEKKA